MRQEYTIKDSVLWIRPRPAGSTASTNKTRPQTRPGALRHFFNVVKYPEKRLTWLASGRTKSREYGTSHYTVYIKKHPEGDGLAFGYYAKPLIFKHKPQNIMRNRYLGQLAVICCLIDGSCVSEFRLHKARPQPTAANHLPLKAVFRMGCVETLQHDVATRRNSPI